MAADTLLSELLRSLALVAESKVCVCVLLLQAVIVPQSSFLTNWKYKPMDL